MNFTPLYLLVFTFKFCICIYGDCDEPNEKIVTTKQGKLSGKTYRSRNGTLYYAYTRIPFAKPPVGQLRFEPPQEPDSWDGIYEANTLPPACMQADLISHEVHGTEDCLYLNVFTTSVEKEKLPVMVWIHGGAFTIGCSHTWRPHYFMDRDIVFVSITYRLGALGFLSSSDGTLPGNVALKDQTAALRWVQENIEAFGGDPKRVTIFGQSAGSSSVSFHLYSPLSKGLFHRAITQSGSSFAIWAITPNKIARNRFKAMGLLAGCPTTSSKVTLDCLKQLPADEIIRIQLKFYTWDTEPNTPFGPVVEFKHAGAFLIKSPWHQDPVNQVPCISGFTSGEGGMKVAPLLDNDGLLFDELLNNYKRMLPLTLNYNYIVEDNKTSDQISEAIKNFYLYNFDINSEESVRKAVDMFTDAYFGHCTMEAALRHKNKNKVFFYYFDHVNRISFNSIAGSTEKFQLGVCHADELFNLFFSPSFLPEGINDGDDFDVSRRMVNYWINFACTGNPNDAGEYLWHPIQTDNLEYLHIMSKEDKMDTNLISDRYKFWDNSQVISILKSQSVIRDEL